MRYQILLAGYGGQGIVFLVKVLARCAYNKNIAFMGTENHGMSQRGGSVRCDIKIGDFSTPVIDRGQADIIIGLDCNESLRQIEYLSKKGCLVTCTNKDFPDIPFKTFTIDLAEDIPSKDISVDKINIYMLGKTISHIDNFPFSLQEVKQALTEVKASYAEDNINALIAGTYI